MKRLAMKNMPRIAITSFLAAFMLAGCVAGEEDEGLAVDNLNVSPQITRTPSDPVSSPVAQEGPHDAVDEGVEEGLQITIDDGADDGLQDAIKGTTAQDLAGTCTLQTYRSGAWRNVKVNTSKQAYASTTTALSWTVGSDRTLWTGGSKMDCGETWSTRKVPTSCIMNNNSDATTYHCGADGANINDCIYNSNGTTMTVDHAGTHCIGYDSNGNLRSYASTSTSCKKFRVICP